jgi:poly(A) polymerase
MLHHLQELLQIANPDERAEELRSSIRKNPLVILQTATTLSRNRTTPAPLVTQACQDEVTTLSRLAPEAIRAELEEGLLGRHVELGLQWMHGVGVVELLLPELAATVDLAQEAGRRHKDVWEHTKQVVKQSVPRPAVRWAALLHDIGKVPTRTFTPHGVHFHGHAEVGARMFDKIARRLPFERGMRQKIRFLIQHHLRSNQYTAEWSDSAVRRFGREMEPHLTDLLDLSRADITSKRPGRRKFLLRQISELARRMEDLRARDARLPALPTGIGNAIMERFALPPSPRIGELKRALEEAVEHGELEGQCSEAYYIDWLVRSGLLT